MKVRQTAIQSFEFVSPTPVSFPSACAKCGKATKKIMAVTVSPTRPNSLEGFLLGTFGGHMGHLIHGILVFKAGSVRIPCCTSCRGSYYLGNFFSFVCLVAGGCGFYFSVNSDLPLWALFLTVIPSVVVFFLWMVPHSIGKAKALPAVVWQEGDGYHYRFVTGAFKEVMANLGTYQGVVPPRLPSND